MAIRDGDRVYLKGNVEREGEAIALIWVPFEDKVLMKIQWDDGCVSTEPAGNVNKVRKRRRK